MQSIGIKQHIINKQILFCDQNSQIDAFSGRQ